MKVTSISKNKAKIEVESYFSSITLALHCDPAHMTMWLDAADAIRLVDLLKDAVEEIAPGVYHQQETIEEAADGEIAKAEAERRNREEAADKKEL